MNPFVQQILMAQGGLPAGRRAHGFGASPMGPGGPVPVHQMNFLRMAPAHMLGGPAGAALGAGHYPYPRQPVPAAAMNMGVAMPMMLNMGGGCGGGGGGGMAFPCASCGGGGGGGGGEMNVGMMDPLTMALLYGGGMGGGGGMNPFVDLFDMAAEDPDDRGAWDIDDDDPDLMAAYLKRTKKRAPRRPRTADHRGAGGLPPGLGGGMPPFMYPMRMGMGVC